MYKIIIYLSTKKLKKAKKNPYTTIDKNLLDDYLQQGWKRGRIFKIKNPS